MTHPYQTQVIPKERRSRFIPLGPPPLKPVPWWHPGQPSLMQRPRERQARPLPPHPQLTMSNNLRPPKHLPPLRPIHLLAGKNLHLTNSNEFDGQFSQRRVDDNSLRSFPMSTVSNPGTNNPPTIDALVTSRQPGSIVRNLEKINNLEKKASHRQKPFVPVLQERELAYEGKVLATLGAPGSGGLSTHGSDATEMETSPSIGGSKAKAVSDQTTLHSTFSESPGHTSPTSRPVTHSVLSSSSQSIKPTSQSPEALSVSSTTPLIPLSTPPPPPLVTSSPHQPPTNPVPILREEVKFTKNNTFSTPSNSYLKLQRKHLPLE